MQQKYFFSLFLLGMYTASAFDAERGTPRLRNNTGPIEKFRETPAQMNTYFFLIFDLK